MKTKIISGLELQLQCQPEGRQGVSCTIEGQEWDVNDKWGSYCQEGEWILC